MTTTPKRPKVGGHSTSLRGTATSRRVAVRLRWRVRIGAGLAMVLTAVAAGAGAAGPPKLSLAGRDFRLSGPAATGNEYVPAAVFNGTANEYLVVWEDYRNAGDFPFDNDIMGRRVSADGSPLGSDLRISGRGATVGELAPAVAWNLDGQRVPGRLAGRPQRRPGAGHLRAAGVGGGVCRWAATSASAAPAPPRTSGPRRWCGTAPPTSTWSCGRTGATTAPAAGTSTGSGCRRPGRPLGANFRISGPGATSDDTTPAVAWNGTANEYLVVWEDGRNGSTRRLRTSTGGGCRRRGPAGGRLPHQRRPTLPPTSGRRRWRGTARPTSTWSSGRTTATPRSRVSTSMGGGCRRPGSRWAPTSASAAPTPPWASRTRRWPGTARPTSTWSCGRTSATPRTRGIDIYAPAGVGGGVAAGDRPPHQRQCGGHR